MHFLSDTDPIYLHTDASDYGEGAYLFQLVDGQETPIAFVSKYTERSICYLLFVHVFKIAIT